MDTPSKNRSDQLRIKHLRLLELVETHGSLVAAAQVLHLSQPTVTHMVQTLEGAFGAALIDRSPRGGQLTDAGRLALAQLRITLASFDRAVDCASRGDARPLVRLGALPLLDSWLLPQTIARLEGLPAAPRLALLHGGIDRVLPALQRGEVDCVVCHVDELPQKLDHLADVHIEPLHEESRRFACGPRHPLARRYSLDLSELLPQPWIIPPPHTQSRRVLNKLFLEQGLPLPDARIESSSFYANLHVVAATQMITFAPSTPVEHFASLGMVKILAVTGVTMPVSRLAFIAPRPMLDLPGMALLRETFRQVASGADEAGA